MKPLLCWAWISVLPIAMACQTTSAIEVIPAANVRFAAEGADRPDFRRHVIPLLTQLGCNAAACHGASGGQSGFQLSLFGYDYEADLVELAEEGVPPRANWHVPVKSQLLRKPTGTDQHDGGKYFDVGSWQYRLLLAWIQARAPGTPAGKEWLAVDRLEIFPAEVVLNEADDRQQLHCVAHWNDGSKEDVTPLCRYISKDESVAAITSDGQVKAGAQGDTHIIVLYDQAIWAIPVFVPYAAATTAKEMPIRAGSAIDQHIARKLARVHIEPSPVCSDAGFLRRASLDITGTIPTLEAFHEFVADPTPNKRQSKVDALLASSSYAEYWAMWLGELLGNDESLMPDSAFAAEQARQWHSWFAARLMKNTSYLQTVRGMVLGLSRRPDQNYEDYFKEMTSYVRHESPTDFSQRATIPYFWARTNTASAEAKTLSFGHAFLGIQLQCAQCHKHPFDRWTQKDFEGLNAFFKPLKYGRSKLAQLEYQRFERELPVPSDRNREAQVAALARSGQTIPWRELYYEEDSRKSSSSVSPLEVLSEWLEDPEHPYLAVSFVNRVWSHYFGQGIVDPPDNLSQGNPPSNRELLDFLASDFIASGYDIKRLHKQIVTSQAYQRSWEAVQPSEASLRNFAHADLRPLSAEVLHDAVLVATAADQRAAVESVSRLVGMRAALTRTDRRNEALKRLGKHDRQNVCERDQRNSPTLSRTLFTQNDPLVHEMLHRPDGWLAVHRKELSEAKGKDLDRHLEECFIRALCRTPTSNELQSCREFLASAQDQHAGFGGIMWALINTKEFCLNH